MEKNPLVSICCVTYNHEPYIRQCLDGFMMQKTDFPFEVIIHDDASTDGTADIIREYEARYPGIIKPIYQKENQYSKGVGISETYVYPRAQGKYIAICEGDDYWIDPYKLQKQVDFLEGHSEYSMCSTAYREIYGHEKKDIVLSTCNVSYSNGVIYNFTRTLTIVYRKEMLLKSNYVEYCKTKYKYSRDLHLIYHLLREGDGYYLKDITSVYNKHIGGVCSLVSPEKKAIDNYCCSKELYWVNRDDVTRKNYFNSLLWLMATQSSFLPLSAMYKDAFVLLASFKEFVCLNYFVVCSFVKRKFDFLVCRRS